MAMLAARLALKKSLQLQQQQQRTIVFSSSSSNSLLDSLLDLLPPKQLQLQQQHQQQLRWSTSSLSSSSSEDENSNDHRNEVIVAQGGNDDDRQMNRKEKFNKSWFPVKLMNKLSSGLWRNNYRERRDLAIPSNLNNLFSSGLGDALVSASDNLNKLIESWALPTARLMGQMKENKSHYKLRFEVPGLSKDEVKITIEDGILTIKGEHKEEEEEEDDEGCFYGYFDTSLLLPDDAKVEEINAEMKDGVLYITIPRTEMKERVIKEIQIN